VEPLL